jgi:hypothetical protein
MAVNLGTDINIVPSPTLQTTGQNYIDFRATATSGWAQQYMPEVYEAEVERYGKRTISGFLEAVGAEEPMASDQVVWSEQGRLHLKYVGAANFATTPANCGIDGLPATNAIRANDMIVIACKARNKVIKAHVTEILTTASIEIAPYGFANLATAGLNDNDVVTIFVYGSEYLKGASGRDAAVEPDFKSFSNKPIIIKDKYSVDGSDTAQIGWVEVSGEDGQSGYMWYLKAEGDTRARFTDYLEMSMVESETKATAGISPEGTEGLFQAITKRGMNTTDLMTKDNFDLILKELDKQGAIEENMLYLDRDTTLEVDDFLAGIDGGNTGAGSAYGVFNNSESMALNLGFTGFRRGSYDFYKTDWKYLNDAQTRGDADDFARADNTAVVRGVLIPAGTSSVYDENLGKNLKRPFLHVRYRASQADDRRFKTWITGSVGGNITSSDDVMNVHYLSERCLVVQAANNFLLWV